MVSTAFVSQVVTHVSQQVSENQHRRSRLARLRAHRT
jgi:hypothetical protein